MVGLLNPLRIGPTNLWTNHLELVWDILVSSESANPEPPVFHSCDAKFFIVCSGDGIVHREALSIFFNNPDFFR